jgi:type VI secretion system protein ImpK
LFEAGSATIAEQHLPLLQRIGEALAAVPGHVQITGHTDNRPIHSIRFQSNWQLSLERARSVSQLLAHYLPTARISAEGRAESEPIASNDTPEGRARNRRVEITLFVSRAGA